jgi:uncharacterized membrane protein
MFGFSYQSRLKNDLTRWIENGWVPGDSAKAILADVERTKNPNRLSSVIGLLGAILLSMGVMLFVSANWDEMSKLLRMIILFAAMWAAFGVAVWLKKTTHNYLHEGMLFLGAAIFGANIMLIAQIYHMDGHYPDALITWALGSVLVAFLLEAQSALLMAFVLLAIWTVAEVFQFNETFHWPFLPVWGVAAWLAISRDWRLSMHGAFLALIVWVVVNSDGLRKALGMGEYDALSAAFVLCLVAFVLAMIYAQRPLSWLQGFETAMVRYFLCAMALLVFIVQINRHAWRGLGFAYGLPITMVVGLLAVGGLAWVGSRRGVFLKTDVVILSGLGVWFGGLWLVKPLAHMGVYAAIVLGVCVWLISLGQRRHDSVMVRLALAAFGAEVLYLYAETLGTLLDTSVFFLFGGVLLIALAFGLEMLRRWLKRKNRHEVAG